MSNESVHPNHQDGSLVLMFGLDDSETRDSLRQVERLKSPDASTVERLEIMLLHVDPDHPILALLGDMLAVNTSLESLKIVDAGSPPIGPVHSTFNMAPIARGLVQNKTITKLHVEGPCFDDDFWSILQQRDVSILLQLTLVRTTWTHLETILPNLLLLQTTANHTALERLEIVDIPLYKEAVKTIATILKSNRCSIKSLNLTKTSLTHVQLLPIARALKKNETLLELNLSYNRISYFNELADTLRTKNHTLEKLVLDGNGLSNAEANPESMFIASCLVQNTGLKVLSAKDCKLSSVGAVFFGEAIQHNDTLEELYLDDNKDVGQTALRELLIGLRRNYRLEKMTFPNTNSWDLRKKIDFWNGISPRGRAIVRGEGPISLALVPNVLHKILRDGGVDCMLSILREQPNLVVRGMERRQAV